jgi:environmental stress-induced protein Ves
MAFAKSIPAAPCAARRMDRQMPPHLAETIMRILRASERTAVPWKNGGGTTSEVAAFPQGAGFDDFGWRISIANIARGGPFSRFPGIDRTLAMLHGRVTLTIEGQGAVPLSPDMPPVSFAGDVATAAELIGGPATDLNVMTRRGAFTARVTRLHANGTITFETDGIATFVFPLAAVTLRGDGADTSFVLGDAIFVEPGESLRLTAFPAVDFYGVTLFSGKKAA